MSKSILSKIKTLVGRDAIQTFYKIFRFVPDKPYLKFLYRIRMGMPLNLKDPKRFNEKLQWIKLYDRKDEYTTMVDKYLVKDYVAKKIGQDYITPTLGVWDKAEDINFNLLPNKFVLKCTHDSYGLVICTDKSTLDIPKTIKKLNRSLKNNFFLSYREWPYKNVRPRIIAEKFIENGNYDESGDLIDYKVLCFNGKPHLIELHNGRFYGTHTQDFYDTNWNLLNISQDIDKSNTKAIKPTCLDKMLELSSILSEGIPHVRVDWYIAHNKPVFGELTFFDGSGFSRFCPDEVDYQLGDLINLPN